MLTRQYRKTPRRGVAVVEFAILAPLLIFLMVIGVDYARVYYSAVTISNCAVNGALYGSQDPIKATDIPAIKQAALIDASNLSPPPDVQVAHGTEADGNPYVEVTVSWRFELVSQYPGVPKQIDLARTVRMRIVPMAPKEPN